MLLPFDQGPGQAGGGRRDVCRHKSVGGQIVGGQGAPRIKTKPSEPQQGGPQNGKGQVVRPEGFLLITHTFPQKDAHHQGRYAGTCMDDNATRKVKGAQIFQPASGSP